MPPAPVHSSRSAQPPRMRVMRLWPAALPSGFVTSQSPSQKSNCRCCGVAQGLGAGVACGGGSDDGGRRRRPSAPGPRRAVGEGRSSAGPSVGATVWTGHGAGKVGGTRPAIAGTGRSAQPPERVGLDGDPDVEAGLQAELLGRGPRQPRRPLDARRRRCAARPSAPEISQEMTLPGWTLRAEMPSSGRVETSTSSGATEKTASAPGCADSSAGTAKSASPTRSDAGLADAARLSERSREDVVEARLRIHRATIERSASSGVAGERHGALAQHDRLVAPRRAPRRRCA